MSLRICSEQNANVFGAVSVHITFTPMFCLTIPTSVIVFPFHRHDMVLQQNIEVSRAEKVH